MTKTEIESQIDSINRIRISGENRKAKQYEMFLQNKRIFYVSLLSKMDENNQNTISV